MLSIVDLIGFAAAGASLIAICSANMLALRVAMVFSNLLFIAWGILGMLLPALVLHAILLPINLCRLWQMMKAGRIGADRPEPAGRSIGDDR